MKVELESTTKIVQLVVNGTDVPARVWEGKTDSGIKVHAYITRIATHLENDQIEFERELQQCKVPSTEILALPLRLIL